MSKFENIPIRITSLSLAALMALGLSGCKTNKEKSQFISESSSIVIEADDYFVSNKKDTNEISNYDELLATLKTNASQFDTDTQQELEELFNIIYTNYDNVSDLLKFNGFPSKDDLIMEKFIEPLKNIKFIKTIKQGDENFLDNLDRIGGASCYKKEENGIYLVYWGSESEAERHRVLFEEIIHSTQKELTESDTMDGCDYYIFGEGEANAISGLLVEDKINNTNSFLFYDENNKNHEYCNHGIGGYHYTLASKYYMYLVTLVGYDTVNSFKENTDSKIISDKLTNLYGIDGIEYYDNMKKVIADAFSDITDKRTDMFVENEQIYYRCLDKRLSYINTEEETKDFFDLYRYMINQYGSEYNEYDENGNYIDKTSTKFDRSAIEEKLFNKMVSFKIFDNLSESKNNQKAIFYALLYPKRKYDESCYPSSLKKCNVSYDGENVIIEYGKDCFVTNLNSRETTVEDNIGDKTK